MRAISRRHLLQTGVAAGLSLCLRPPALLAAAEPLIQRKIPSSGESLPVVGIGTAGGGYEAVTTDAARASLKEVLHRFQEIGGRVVDTAPSYGTAEAVVGDLVSGLGIRGSLFLATKVEGRRGEAGIEEVEQSFKRLRTTMIDLIAVHNLQDTANQLATLRRYKREGRIRYVGITTSFPRQYSDFERTMKAESLDFIQVDYALDNRTAAERILPLAADRGMAVMINLPFGRRRLFQAVRGRALPAWAAEFECRSWAQFFLKYVVSHPAVTCAIPGTANASHVADNLAAARGRLPDMSMRRRMEEFIDAL